MVKAESFDDPWENRTPVAGVRGRSLNRLTNGPSFLLLRTFASNCAAIREVFKCDDKSLRCAEFAKQTRKS